MSLSVTLDLRTIIGEIDLNTPSFIILYILNFCRKQKRCKEEYFNNDEYYSEVIDVINNFNYLTITNPSIDSSDEDLKLLSKFISPYKIGTVWSSVEIIKGYKDMIMYDINSGEMPALNKNNIVFGNKEPNNPYVMNEIIVYCIAKIYSYRMNRNTTFEELKIMIKNLSENRINSIKNSLLHTINSMSNSDILKLHYDISNVIEVNQKEDNLIIPESKNTKFNFNQKMFMANTELLLNKNKILRRVKPETSFESILIACNIYGIDITDSSSPLSENELLKNKKYIPYCTKFAEYYNINPNWYNLNINWSENLAPHIYKSEDVVKFLLNEGYINPSGTLNELNECMRSTRKMPNFYFSKVPYCKSKITVVNHEEIDKIPQDELICVGKISTSELVYITIYELYSFFESEKVFVSPNEIKYNIDEIQIQKLKNHCKKMFELKKKIIFKDMITLISSIDKAKKLISNKVYELKEKIKKLNEEDYNKVDKVLQAMVDMGLYMRGWKINKSEKYPLEIQDTLLSRSHENKVQENTVIAHDIVIDYISELPLDIAEDIKNLRALEINKEGNKEEVFGMNFRGIQVYHALNLFQCVKAIYSGLDPTKNDKGCIRTLSGMILFSACWYRFIFGFKNEIEMDKIDNIQ